MELLQSDMFKEPIIHNGIRHPSGHSACTHLQISLLRNQSPTDLNGEDQTSFRSTAAVVFLPASAGNSFDANQILVDVILTGCNLNINQELLMKEFNLDKSQKITY